MLKPEHLDRSDNLRPVKLEDEAFAAAAIEFQRMWDSGEALTILERPERAPFMPKE